MAADLPAILTERVRLNGAEAEATFSPAECSLRWRSRGGGERCVNLESEVLGFEAKGMRITLRAFQSEHKEVSCIGGGVGKRGRRNYVLEMPTDEAAWRWIERISSCFDSFGRPKKLFILVNPFGGKKCATKIFDNEIKPLLIAADILYTMQETMHQLHAQEIANSLDLTKYDGIVCVSGDGVLVEVVNGLLRRQDWDSAIKIPLGIIPAGTGNGMAKSLSHSVGDMYSVSNSTFAVIRGHKRALDVATVLQGQIKFFSILMLTWGLIADIDIESEKYRWMGSARLDFYALLRIMNLRKYHGQVEFVPAPGYEGYGEPLKDSDGCNSDFGVKQGHRDDNVQLHGYSGSISSLERFEWRSLDGPFILVWINNVPWSGEDIMPAPKAEFADGYCDAIIIRDCPQTALLSMMLSMSDGSYAKSQYVTYLKVKAFRLKPGMRAGHPKKGGIIDSDGEVIARGDISPDGSHQEYLMAYGPPIQITVNQGLATIFTP